ncbi:MAG: CHAT domain-containing protein, partial [Cyanobacteria bacterium 0813]|nr:CHAT domain-containing protein [Cyanobacteria bacterium 0813]
LPVVAQTTDARQAEGDRLLQQGIQQYQTGQFPAALKSWQQALQIYRALKNREGEGGTLGKLMQSFYQNLQNNPDKAQALRQAMLATMKTHPGPRNWAAFTLIGEAE